MTGKEGEERRGKGTELGVNCVAWLVYFYLFFLSKGDSFNYREKKTEGIPCYLENLANVWEVEFLDLEIHLKVTSI